ncbi:MAG: 2Fe-2S iron-sulfur cluster binding domain-containing protein [Deltaproteobacteria bacterium]|nr:2Fe-2S iron-sulfur cluster binding domain-containing protein [Deltaproteobacteria bacterium]
MSLGQKMKWVLDSYFTPLTSSHYIELLNPLWADHQLHAKVVAVIDETKTARTLVLQPGRNWRIHRPGQHIRVGVTINGARHTRTYSLSSAPEAGGGQIAITVKASEGGFVSRHLTTEVKVGDLIPVGLPQGLFVMPEAGPVRPLFVTGGSGITPVMAMLRSLAIRRSAMSIVHIHYARHAWDVIFGQELRAMHRSLPNYRLIEIYTENKRRGIPGISDQPADLHLTRGALTAICPDWQDRESWVCGPTGLNEAALQIWRECQVESRLCIEAFHAKLAPLPGDAKGGVIKLQRSQKEISSDGQSSILQVAEAAGINLPHGCRMGICHGCNATLIAGTVRDLRTGAVRQCSPGETVQICVTAVSGDSEFDV